MIEGQRQEGLLSIGGEKRRDWATYRPSWQIVFLPSWLWLLGDV